MLGGFVNEMDALAACPYTYAGFLLSSSPSPVSAALPSPFYSSGDFFPDCNVSESGYHHLATPGSRQLPPMLSRSPSFSLSPRALLNPNTLQINGIIVVLMYSK